MSKETKISAGSSTLKLDPERDLIPASQYALGVRMVQGIEAEKNIQYGMKLIEIAAERGHVKAQIQIADLYYKGTQLSEEIPQNLEKARQWFLIAASDGNNFVAQQRLGEMYEYGDGVIKNLTKAMDWYRIAAEQGDAISQHNLGVAYERGLGVKTDYVTSFKWYEAAAKNGFCDSMHNLGNCYNHGIGTDKDLSKALYWFYASAKKGDMDSAYALGKILCSPERSKEEHKEGIDWLMQAVKNGNYLACYELGVIQAEGKLIKQNLDNARVLLSMAANAGLEKAKDALNRI